MIDDKTIKKKKRQRSGMKKGRKIVAEKSKTSTDGSQIIQQKDSVRTETDSYF